MIGVRHSHRASGNGLLSLIATGLLGLLATLLIATDDSIRFAYRNDELRVATETTVALIALVLGSFAYIRFRASRLLSDLLVTVAVLVFSYANFAYTAVPLLIGGTDSDRFAVWAPLFTRALAAVLLAASPWVSGRVAARTTAGWWVASIAAATVAIGIVLALAPQLPSGVRVSVPIESSSRPRFDADPTVVVLQGLVSVLFLAVVAGSVRMGRRQPDDEFWHWLGIGAACQVISRVHFVLYPSLFSDWFYTGDLFRLLGYVAWLVGVGNEIRRAGDDRARVAVLEERRRMARELHDGLVQELSFIHSQMADGRVPTPEMVEHIATGANRALREARLAVAALSDTPDPPEIALRAAAERIAIPAGLQVTCSFQPSAVVAPEIRHDLARIVQEAASNAVKHSGATSIAVHLDCPAGGGLWLMVSDDGCGFDPDAVDGGGFGMTTMRERADRIGGRLSVSSGPGEGTVIEVLVEQERTG